MKNIDAVGGELLTEALSSQNANVRSLVAYYSLNAESVRIVQGGKRRSKDVFARWSVGLPDSLENRQEILEAIRRSLNVDEWDTTKLSLELSGLVPPGFPPENKSALYAPLAAFRAKCVVTITINEELTVSLDNCFLLQERIGAALDSDDFGYVDGNDIGGGCFRIFCFGRRKAKLLQIVEESVKNIEWAKVTVA